jgi:hypothetical protein
MPESEPQAGLKRRVVVSAALLAAYAAIVGWAFYGQATSWPHEGSWALVAYVFLCPGIVFQALNLLYRRLKGRALARRMLTRLVTVPVGVMLAAFLAVSGSALAMRGFEQAYGPFVAQLAADLAGACATGAKHFGIASVAAYNRQAGRERPQAKLRHDGKRFVVSLSGGSIDIDGSTIYYDSVARAWGKFHNDDAGKSGAFAKLTEGLAECVLRAG